MQPHQQRVVEEKADLDVKIAALQKFLQESPMMAKLDRGEVYRLNAQNLIMVQYSAILGERIQAFAG